MSVGDSIEESLEATGKGRAGFTLIELIVVIGVIAILFVLMFPAVTSLKEKARAKEAEVTKNALMIAIRAFRTEYGYWPGPTPDVNSVYTNSTQLNVIRYLLSTSTSENPKGIPFWESTGVVTNNSTRKPFSIKIDVDNDTVTVN